MPKVTLSPHDPTALMIAKYPNWTTLPQANIKTIQCDHRMNCEIDATGAGRIQIKPGYNASPVDEVRYTY